MLKRLIALTFLLGGCATGLGDHQDPGNRQDLGARQDLAALPQSCSGLQQADCARATGCHLIFTSDELCDSACCASHFAYCTDGKSANCDAQRMGVCSASCALPTPTCLGSLVSTAGTSLTDQSRDIAYIFSFISDQHPMVFVRVPVAEIVLPR